MIKRIIRGISATAIIIIAVICTRDYSLAQKGTRIVINNKIPFAVLRPGYVSMDGVVTYEDVEKLTPKMSHAVALLRSGRYQQSEAIFRQLQQQSPMDALAYRGENEAARNLSTLAATISHYRKTLLDLAADNQQSDPKRQAVLHYALGDALMLLNYTPRFVGDNPARLSPEAEQELLEAIRLDPTLLPAHLALATYYEHPSQQLGDKARLEYDQALKLRPELYKIRYLHAATWDRPMYIPPQEEANLAARNITIQDEQKMLPKKTIAECLELIHDYPTFALPYLRLSHDYAWPLNDRVASRKYLLIYTRLMSIQKQPNVPMSSPLSKPRMKR